MIPALYTAVSGLRVYGDRQRVASNNIANANTPGFKKGRVVARSLPDHGGAVTADIDRTTTQGYTVYTGYALDAAISGEGFFVVRTPDGRTAYTRQGRLRSDEQGRLTDAEGNLLEPEITLPPGAESITISPDGQVSATVGGQQSPLGQIVLARFNNPSGLDGAGGGLFFETAESGPPLIGQPQTAGLGALVSGYLEGSNVDLAEEMAGMIITKHGYVANLKAIRAADELLGRLVDMKS